MTADHDVIWLQPWCAGCEMHASYGEGRRWCQDDVFEPCEECGQKSVKYVRGAQAMSDCGCCTGGDTGEPMPADCMRTEIERLTADNARLRARLELIAGAATDKLQALQARVGL